jgi:CarD family transcriptional regulator
MAKHKMAAQRTASKAARNGRNKKAPAARADQHAKSLKQKAKVETKKNMSSKSTAAARPKAPAATSSPAKAAAAKPLAAKVLNGAVKDAKAPVAVAANANAKPTPAKGFVPKLAAAGGAPVPPGKQPARPVPTPPPKPAANGKEPEFNAGDYVVYPTHGVGRIQGVVTQEIAGTSLKVIVITSEKERMTLRVPVGKATNSGLRRLSSRKEMETALKTLKGRSRIRRMMWSRRAQEYEAKINSGDPVSIAEVVRDLYRNAGQPDQSYSERQIYQAALDRLARELAAVEKIDETAAAQKLESVLRAA